MRHGGKRSHADPRRRAYSDAPAPWRRVLALILITIAVLAAGFGAKVLQERRAHNGDNGLVTIGPHKD